MYTYLPGGVYLRHFLYTVRTLYVHCTVHCVHTLYTVNTYTVPRPGGVYLRHPQLQEQGGRGQADQQGAGQHQEQVQGIIHRSIER